MNLSALNLNLTSKTQSFKGTENKTNNEATISPDALAIKESIDKNTEALKALTEQASINNYTMFAIEKSKSGTNGLHRDSYSKTDNPVDFIKYINRHWSSPRY